MVEKLLDKASYSLVRTNPKLTGNVKLVSNGDDIYLESFNANNRLSDSRFKAFKVDGKSTYDNDVFNFFQKGKFPKDLAYEVFQEFQDISVLSDYGYQYEMFYSAGTRSVASDAYTEDLGMLAPLWINEQIPNYFVVFRLDNPSAINTLNADTPNEDEDIAQNSSKFNEFILENCTAIKTFDLTENSKLGSYIRRYRDKDGFPKAPLSVSWRKDEPFLWNGISYNKGGFASSGNFVYDDLITQDATIIQNEYFITQGFQRNGILSANLINFEFLFSDEYAEDYSINRYFGLYVNEIEEGQFDISGEGFYKNSEKTQLPKLKTITEVSQFLDTPFEISNDQGVLVFLDQNKTTTITGLPTPQRVNEVESIFYVKDKDSQFHTVKKGSNWSDNQIRLFDKRIDISKLAGFKNPDTFAKGEVIKERGHSSAYIKVIDEVIPGSIISFYDGNDLIGQISANESLTSGPGTYHQSFFNPTGTTDEIAKAIVGAIENGISEELRYFNPSINQSTVYLKSRFSGSRFNDLSFKISYIDYPELEESFETYPVTNISKETASFIGGTDVDGTLLKVKNGDQDRFKVGNFIKTKGGYTEILGWSSYLREPKFSANDTQIGYTGVNDYVIVFTKDNQIDVTLSGQVALYSDYKPSFGRFSIFPIRDFDFDFYSKQYSQLGELNFEYDEYNQFNLPSTGGTGAGTGTSNRDYFGLSSWPEIRSFYDDGGFSNLIGLLKDADPDVDFDISIESEYERLEENYLKQQSVASRTIPYINKWSWHKDGKDVRNNPYRLNVNLSFGTNNFSPSKWNLGRSPEGFSHEWYYLCEFPSYFTKEAVESSWSYIDEAPSDNTIVNSELIPGTFQDVSKDYFTDYFVIDRFDFQNEYVPIDKQLRYGRFSGGDRENFAECFLRGVRVIAKPKSDGSQKPNFNANKLSYLKDGRFNDYRFSVMVIPNEPGKPKNQIKFIKNDKWKTVVMLIFIEFAIDCLDSTGKSVDRTSLYSINNDIDVSTSCDPIGTDTFKNSSMQGAISFAASSYNTASDQYLIQGITDVEGNPTRFIRDIRVGADGQYTPIQIETQADTFIISGISKVLSDDQILASTITKSGNPITLPSPSPSTAILKQATYTLLGGGFGSLSKVLDEIGFASLFNNVNEGNPNIIYETIDTEGNQVLSDDGSLAQTFSIELRSQDDILKSSYIGILPDPNKPTVFNLTDIIGYDLSLQTKPRINPIARHSGYYEPLSKDVVFFQDPYIKERFDEGYTGDTGLTGSTGSTGGSGIIDAVYKEKVFDLCRFTNSQFLSSHENFGVLLNYFYHKVNQEDPSSVLELSTDSAFLSVYPLINEVGIDYKDYYMFSSNWDPGYFTKSIDKSKVQSIIGTRSMLEKKAFYASKYLKVPQQITLQTFTPSPYFKEALIDNNLVDGEFMYIENNSNFEFYMLIQKKLQEYLFSFVKPVFEEYINVKYGFGNIDTLNDDVNKYIELNILKLYKIDRIDLYTKSSREISEPTYTTAELTNSEKEESGLSINQNVSSISLNKNAFDLKLIYNKTAGFSESFGFSVTIVKK